MPDGTLVGVPLRGSRMKSVQELQSGTPIKRGGVVARLKWRKLRGISSGR